MAINATNYDGTKDYKIAEVGDVYHPNLLINGDFQVNQRGGSNYTASGASAGVRQYTVDMWNYINASGLVIIPQADGIYVDNTSGKRDCYFSQILPNLESGTYTVSFEVLEKTGDVTFYMDGINSDSHESISIGKNIFTHTGKPTTYVFYLKIGARIKLKYCDLFEGDIAYPHVKEDYAIALYRCMRYFTRYGKNYSKTLGVGYVRNDHKIRFVYNFPAKMHSKPTVKLTGMMELETEQQGYNTITSIIASEVSEDKCTISGTAGYDYVVGMNVTVYFSDHNLASYIDLSCEP